MGYGWGEGSSPWGEQTELETNIIPDWSSWIAPQFWENSAQDLDEFNLDGNPYDKRRDEYLSGMYGDLEADYQRGLENIKHAFAVRNDLESPAYHAAIADYEDAYQRRKANITSQFAMGAAGADIDLHGRSMDNVFKSAMMSRGFYDSDMDRADQYYRDEMADMWNWDAAQEADWTRRQGYADDGMRLLLGYLTGSPFPTYGETNTGLSGLAKIMAERAENAGLQGSELGRVIYNLAKEHYTYKKTFRIVQPNNDMSEYMVNFYNDKSQAIGELHNDLTIGQYDVNIIGNSTMPSNRWGEWSIYMEAFKMGLIDRTEALMKTDIFDKEGVLQRMDIVQQLQQQLASAEQQIKNLSGDLQTAHRESISARKRTEVEKFKSNLNEIKLNEKAVGMQQSNKLTNAVKLESEKLRLRGESQAKQERLQKGDR